ncbi:fungal-specific transcription factor domain-containing protein [Xylogone sp. PMI_703]|nr:fungal-specific transcription factor domain-containing protein [Xylogone sp. PMI_703]
MENDPGLDTGPNNRVNNQSRRATVPPSRRKTLNACQRCRRKKIKCSGLSPCQNCSERGTRCMYQDLGKKVVIPEAYLEHLKSTINRLEEQVANKPLQPDQQSVPVHETAIEQDEPAPNRDIQGSTIYVQPNVEAALPLEDTVPPVQNPLTSSQSFFLTDTSGKQRYLGSSSSWSFSWQIRRLLKEKIASPDTVDLIPSSEEDTYSMASASIRDSLSSTPLDFPSRDYAEYLTNTTAFHLEPVYHIFVKHSFMQKLDQFYEEQSFVDPPKSLWLVQFFLVVAFGKLFLRRGASALGPPGAKDFLQAMRLKSDLLDFCDDPVLGIEVLCLISLYLFTADIRSAAYTFIGQAMRMALSLGMNRNSPPGSLDISENERRRRLWWTVYIIDRKLSMNMGAPLSIEAKDIDVPLPLEGDLGVSNSALILHCKLEMLEGMIMNAGYGINSTFNKAFISGIEEVFSTMTKLAESFAGKFDLNSNHSTGISRVAATLHLIYYQCTIMATRTIMFTLVQQRLAINNTGPQMTKTVSEPVIVLLRTCIGAATTIIKILAMLHEQDLVEPFLPFDLQSVFSAAFILILTTIAYPPLVIDKTCITKADEILLWMSSKGNIPANSRRRELKELEDLAMTINNSSDQPSFSSATNILNSDRLWNNVEIDGDGSRSDAQASISLMGSDFLDGEIPDDLQHWQWFWAVQD